MTAVAQAGLEEFRSRRLHHKAADKYTVVVDGVKHNSADYRDNTADILEELSDAHNIAGLAMTRVPGGNSRLVAAFADFQHAVEVLMFAAVNIRALLPPDMKRDQAEVLGDQTPHRIVTLEEVGL